MKISKIKYLCILAASGIIITSCNNLDQFPKDKYTEETFWLSQENSEKLVNMAYNQMYGADKMWNDEALSDNLIQARDANDLRMIRNGLATPGQSVFANEWSWGYSGIKTCHKYLENIDKVPSMSEDLKQIRKAEIRFIRAFLYFRLTNFYGAIPFFTEDITLQESYTISRTPKSEVIKFIHEELDDIIDILPTKANTEKGRITNGAAVAFQARVYLYDSNWAEVEKYTSWLMEQQNLFGNYELFPDYETLFQSQNKYNSEVILDYSFGGGVRIWSEMYQRVPMSQGAQLNKAAPLQELVDSYWTINGLSINDDSSYNPNPILYYLTYQNRDPRLTATVVYDGFNWVNQNGETKIIRTAYGSNTEDSWQSLASNRSVTGYYIRKYYDPKSQKELSNLKQENNIIMFRYADILLMYAEAMFEQNKMSTQVWDKTIRLLRTRAGFTKNSALDYPQSLSADEMKELIRNERRIELAMEGLRYYDIVRWKEGEKYLNGIVYGAKFANNNTSFIVLDNRKFNPGKDYLWSVPLQQMELNNNLRPNNPGYMD